MVRSGRPLFGTAISRRMVNTEPFCGCSHHSQGFGNTQPIADAVAAGLLSHGCEVDLPNTDECRFDVARFPQYDCAAFGSPDPSAAMWRVG